MTIRALRDAFMADIAKVSKYETNLIPPTNPRRPVLWRSLREALIGLSPGALSATSSAADNVTALATKGVPCWPELTRAERLHEEALVSAFEGYLTRFIDQFHAIAIATKATVGCPTFEVDAAKRLYRSYGARSTPSGVPERIVRATANHALHPIATLIARLALLKELDALSSTVDEIFVTNGGCGAGKGSLLQTIKLRMGGRLRASAVWDAAGEGEAEENAWILDAARARSRRVIYGFVANDPLTTYANVLDRALETGRIVDPVTFARSYTRGHANMRAFLASRSFMEAARAGVATALGLHAGSWDPASGTYPNARLLNIRGELSATDLDGVGVPNEADVIQAAIATLQRWLNSQRKSGSVDRWVKGAVINPLKFENWS